MVQLRKRIEALERWTDKLKNDRETVEVNFRHHSKEQENMTLDFLEKMRELQAARSSNAGNETRQVPQMDENTIERLQDLSALLTKQTRDLEETLSEKTRQICQLRWELLHRDLSSIKRETELHSHSAALKKRTKYGNLRSRSSEEAPASTCLQKLDSTKLEDVSTDIYCSSLQVDEFKATHLANTVQQLNKEVLKLTSATSNSSLAKQLQDENLYSVTMPKILEGAKYHRRIQSPAKDHSRKITVRRSSADNLSLVSAKDNRLKDERSSTSQSEDSSDEYYSRICYNTAVKASQSNNSDTERLLMSYGEHPPRAYTQRRKKLQKSSKLQHSCLSRKRSNTFHTNRDLQKPNISENTPQKCQSFREAREKKFQYSTIEEPAPIKLKFRNLPYYIKPQEKTNYKINNEQDFREVFLRKKSVERSEILKNYNNMLLREVASDSKIPFLIQAQNDAKDVFYEDKNVGKSPSRSMSDKTKQETAAERRDHIQKKRIKKRLKSPDSLCIPNVTTTSETNPKISEHIFPYDTSKFDEYNSVSCTSSKSVSRGEKDSRKSRDEIIHDAESNILNLHSDIPTITIQLPKRKQSRTSCNSSDDVQAPEEHSFTIVIPKKRSLSTDHESSLSENSSREISKSPHSDTVDTFPNISNQKSSATNCHSNHPTTTSKTEIGTDTNGKIKLMRLVSLDNFESPFEPKGDHVTKVSQETELQPRKRKAEDTDCSGKNSPTEEMVDMISSRLNSHNLSKRSTAYSKRDISQNVSSPSYVKSPSAPQLDWRKVCAKKVSKGGAPNVRTLIEKYNQKVIESQICTSPGSSTFSSPVAPRKISEPAYNSAKADFVPHFISTPNTPNIAPPFCSSPLSFAYADFSKNPPSSPSSVARSEALRRAKENFIASKNSAPNTPNMFRPIASQKDNHVSTRKLCDTPAGSWSSDVKNTATNFERSISEYDRMSNSSMDSMNIVMLRAAENCRESRLPKRTIDAQKIEASSVEGNKLKTSKSLSSSSLFKTVLNSDFKLPTNLLKLKRSKRKKDMSTVTELCRQSLLLTVDDVQNIASPEMHKSCPNSPELKSKSTVKPNWLHRNIFRQK